MSRIPDARVMPYRIAVQTRWRAILDAVAEGHALKVEEEARLYEAEMNEHDKMIAALRETL